MKEVRKKGRKGRGKVEREEGGVKEYGVGRHEEERRKECKEEKQ